MNRKELQELIGRTLRLNLDGLEVDVEILDARISFGRIDILITPTSGSGEKWVQFKGEN